MAIFTVFFEDNGQDFLEWDINDDGVVVESRPFQNDIWRNTVMKTLKEGELPLIITTHSPGVAQLKHRVVKIALKESNPFLDKDGHGAVDTVSRLDRVQRFDLDQCQAALLVPDLQKTVKNKIRSRIRKLEKETSSGN
jgi:hypothetical protein